MFSAAAESIAAAAGMQETVVDVLHGRALRHYAEGLRQYLALRLGSEKAARTALDELKALVIAMSTDDLVASPGIRARLYRLARQLADRSNKEPNPTLVFRRPNGESLPASIETIVRLRHELEGPDRELLELRYARELRPDELAFVLDAPLEELLERLNGAAERVRSIAGLAGSDQLRRLLIEAFALRPELEVVDYEVLEEAPALPAGTIIGGRYSIETRAGSGSFADVYVANDTEVPGHTVALKLLHQPSLSSEARDRALRELHLIASVFHPSIVQFKDHGWHEERLWFVMPWYEGETLEDRIRREPLSRKEAHRIFYPLARALSAMHVVGIRHQDVKPDNIFLARLNRQADQDVLPVLLDLGVAAKEAEMVVAGTPTYFAPEVAAQFASIRGHRLVTTRADVFSLALSLRNALEPETQDEVAAGAVEAFIEYRAQNGASLPEGRELGYLKNHFRRWLALDPEDRPTADELAEELSILTRPEEVRARRIALLKWLVPAVITVLVLFTSVVYVLSERAEREKLEAREARISEAAMREDLEITTVQKEALETEVGEIRDQYEESELTRDQLAAKLAKAEGEGRILRRNLRAVRRRANDIRKELGTTRGELDKSKNRALALEGTLAKTERTLREAEQREAGQRQRAEQLTLELGRLRERTEAIEQRARETETQLTTVRAQLEAEIAKSGRLERTMQAALEEQSKAKAELERAERRITELEAELRGLRARKAPEKRPPPPSQPAPTAAPASGAEPSTP